MQTQSYLYHVTPVPKAREWLPFALKLKLKLLHTSYSFLYDLVPAAYSRLISLFFPHSIPLLRLR